MMNRFTTNILLILVILICPMTLSAHQDSYYISKFKKVTVRFKTGFEFEEINKSKFIGEYCSILAKQLNYKGKIFIDLIHDYGNSMEAASFIAFNNGNFKVYRDDRNYGVFSKEKKQRIVIRQIQNVFDISKVLKELEYAINNLKSVKENSIEIKHKGYSEKMFYLIKSIPFESINKIHQLEESSLVKEVLSKMIRRPETDDYNRLSYFTKNGKYFLFRENFDNVEVIDSVNHIHSFNCWDSSASFIFTSPKEFFCIYENFLGSEKQITAHYTIDTVKDDYYQSIYINKISDGIFGIYHYKWGIDNLSVFYVEDEFLISDFKKELINLKNKK